MVGMSSETIGFLKQISQQNFELIAGDITKTLPRYIKKNPHLKISLLNIDIDFVESTFCSLEYLYPRVSKGGIILLDNYGYAHGDTKGVDLYFKKIKKKTINTEISFYKQTVLYSQKIKVF